MYPIRSQVKFNGIAILAVALALVLILILDPWLKMTQSPFGLFFGAVMASAWYGGTIPGLVATSLSVFFSGYLFLNATDSLSLDLPHITRVGLFLPQGVLFSVLCGALHKVKESAETSMRILPLSQEDYRCILDTANEGIWILDAQLRTSYVSDRCCEMLGYTSKEILQRPIFDFIDKSLHNQVNQHLTQQRQQAIKTQFNITFSRRDKSNLLVIASTNSIFNPQGEFLSFLLMLTDISEQQFIKQALSETEARFDNLAANVPGVICQFRQDPKGIGEFIYISSGCFDLYEIESDKIRQNPRLAWSVIHPDDFQDLRQSLIDYAATGEQWRHEWRIITPSGKTKWVQGIARSEPQLNGSVVWNAILLDISDRKRTEDNFRQIFESNMIGMKFWRGDNQITLANQAYLNIIGYTQADLKAGLLKLVDLTAPEYHEVEKQALAEIRSSGTCTPYEKEYIRKDNSRISVLIGGARLDEQGESGICFVMDISDRKLLENQLREKAAELNQASSAKDQFLAVLSHELRTPLTSILGWTQMLRTRNFNEKTTKIALETIERNACLQKQLIEDLLDISWILQGKLTLKRSPMSLVGVIEAAIRSVQAIAKEKSIHLELAFSDDDSSESYPKNHAFPPPDILPTTKLPINKITPIPDEPTLKSQFWVYGDSKRLQQIVYNLLSNAIKFTPIGGRVDITLATEGLMPYAEITVTDTGIGISQEFLPYVFDRFRQADSTITRKFGGLGLGLAIVHHLVEMHGGTITAQSPGEEQGATFTVKLPLLK